MKKKILAALLVGGIITTMSTGCGDNREYLNEEIDGLKVEISELENQRDLLKSEMDDMDIAGSTCHCFDTRKEAEQYCVNSLKNDIQQLENRVNNYEKSIKECKSTLRKKNALLKKYIKEDK